MIIKERTTYDLELSNKDIEGLANTINVLYQFNNNPKVWEEFKDNAISVSVKRASIPDIISTLEEIGGEEYQRYIKKVG